MTDDELLTLVAKDYVIKTHRFAVLNWSADTWFAAVRGIRATFTDETLINARIAYPDAYKK